VATLTVKGHKASAHQVANIVLLVKIGKRLGANHSQLAGALATMMQESSCINLKGGDRDSMGLYQQRPSCSWGSPAQVTNPNYAIDRFMRPYLTYCRQGYEPIRASHKVQVSAYPEAPRQWYRESWKDIDVVTGGRDIKDVTISGVTLPTGGGGAGDTTTPGVDYGTDITITRDLPYEFTRGSPDKRESSWAAIGRLGDEVNWRRWMRRGALCFASENYLNAQPVRHTFAQGVRGCISIEWSADSRRPAAECTVTALARRWSVLPGDVVRIANEGPADGLWLVKSTRRSIDNATTEISLMRSTKKQPEPAPQQTTSTVHVAGVAAGAADKPGGAKGGGGLKIPSLTVSGYNAADAPTIPAKAYAAAEVLSRQNLPYVYGGAHGPGAILSEHPPPTDCSSGVCWVLIRSGIRIPGSQSQACVSGDFTRWGLPGRGKYMTVMCNAEHVWIRWYGLGAWRFDTSGYRDSYTRSSGGRNRRTPRPEGGFVHRHWPGT
jgi:hypothetical protein